MYVQGHSVVDYKESAKWFLLTAEQGLALSQLGLGLSHGDGLGVVQTYLQNHLGRTIL